MLTSRSQRLWVVAEAVVWTVALAFVLVWLVRYVNRVIEGRRGVQQFETQRTQKPENGSGKWAISVRLPDLTLWSPRRIAAWKTASAQPGASALAVLRIPRIHLEVPILEGTDDTTLDRALGHIEETAMPGEAGNAGIAGHRDGFFRGLKDIAEGDVIELETRRGKEQYRIQRTWIVAPDDVSVLDPTPTRALTLVTCYPFYFVGSAPERFIVRAVPVDESKAPAPIKAGL
jgi:sortase A